jgi:hypothetical protein
VQTLTDGIHALSVGHVEEHGLEQGHSQGAQRHGVGVFSNARDDLKARAGKVKGRFSADARRGASDENGLLHGGGSLYRGGVNMQRGPWSTVKSRSVAASLQECPFDL